MKIENTPWLPPLPVCGYVGGCRPLGGCMPGYTDCNMVGYCIAANRPLLNALKLGPILDYEDAQLLWEIEFPSKPDALLSMLNRRALRDPYYVSSAGQAYSYTRSILSFMRRNAIGGIHLPSGETFCRAKKPPKPPLPPQGFIR